jgi:iron-sulfur cluster repair protein YtfE (RIC family)
MLKMKSITILELMIEDHNRLMEYLKDVENNFGRDFGFLSESFNTFQWNLEKHFFVEERAIFGSYKPDEPDKEYSYFSDIMDQHAEILEKIESLRKKLEKRKPFDVDEIKKLLIKHKNFEEKYVYPIIDQEIDEGEKHFIIDRIRDIRL